jgi:hypothetical protein
MQKVMEIVFITLLIGTCFGKIATNGFGLGEVVCRLVRWENCAKPVLTAGTEKLAGCLIEALKKSF